MKLMLLIFFIIFHFVIWPLINLFLNKILDPIIIFCNFLTNLFKTKNVEEKINSKESSITKLISFKFENINKWFSERFMLKTLLITPFIVINYILMCLEYNSTIFPISSNILSDSL